MPRGGCWVFESWWHMTLTFDLESYFHTFPAQAIPFAWLYLATSFLMWWYIFKMSRSRFSFKVMGPRSRSRQHKSCSMQLKSCWSETAGTWSQYLLQYCSKWFRAFDIVALSWTLRFQLEVDLALCFGQWHDTWICQMTAVERQPV